MDLATRQALRSFPPAMWVLTAGNFVNRFGGFVVPMLALHLTNLGYSAGQVSWVLGAYGAGRICSAFPVSGWIERYGHRNVIVAATMSTAAMMLVLSQLTSYPAILAATLALGFTADLFRPATSALIAEFAAPKDRVTAFALNRLAINAGFAFGPALGGWIAHHSFFWVFAGNAITEVIYGFIAWRGLPARIELHAHAGPKSENPWSEVLADRKLLWFLAAIFPTTFIYMQGNASLPLYTHSLGIDERGFGLLCSINGIMIVVGELTLTGFTRRFSPLPVLMLGYLLLGVGYACTGFAHAWWPLAFTVMLWTLGEMLSAPLQSSVLANMAPNHLRARYMAASSFLWSAATIVGPFLGVQLYNWSPRALWWYSAAVGVASAAMIVVALRKQPAAAAAGLPASAPAGTTAA